jgi:HD-GYP domain-containing protein (c-di-GMP phosphodiesterase class II)
VRSARVDEAVQVLARALREHHRGTAEHSHRCAALAGCLARRLGLPADEVFEAELVALLHDVGKLMVDRELLDQRSLLTPAQRSRICRHAADGGAILAATAGLEHLAHAVRATHEHYDGTGYPDGLAGDEIPLAARIVACADAYDAMSATRAYRRALPVREAVRRLELAAGSQLDPALVDALLETLPDAPARTLSG